MSHGWALGRHIMSPRPPYVENPYHVSCEQRASTIHYMFTKHRYERLAEGQRLYTALQPLQVQALHVQLYSSTALHPLQSTVYTKHPLYSTLYTSLPLYSTPSGPGGAKHVCPSVRKRILMRHITGTLVSVQAHTEFEYELASKNVIVKC